MALMEYFQYDGVEIFNALRVGSYARNMSLEFFKCDDACSSLEKYLEDHGWKSKGQPYTVPWSLTNRAPWHDDTIPVSLEFAGAHLLDVSNIGSSVRTGSTNEYIGDGGWVQGSRRSSREMVFRALLLGKTLEGARYGLAWLNTVLEGGDVCSRVKRVRNTYSDISFGWIHYKRDMAELIPDNVFQANEVHGCATGPLPEQGNTYGNLRDCAMPHAFPLAPPDESIYAKRPGLKFKLDFLIDCPKSGAYSQTMRHIEECEVLTGPVILSEHVLGRRGKHHHSSGDDHFSGDDHGGGDGQSGDAHDDDQLHDSGFHHGWEDCDDGAWVEVEFSILGGNPGVWWNTRNVLLTQASDLTYNDFMPCGKSPGMGDVLAQWAFYKKEGDPAVGDNVFQANQFNGIATGDTTADGNTYLNLETRTIARAILDPLCPSAWIMYKGGQPLPIDDDVYDGPLAWGRSQTYGGLLGAIWDRNALIRSSPVQSTSTVLANDMKPTPTDGVALRNHNSVLLDPACPAPPGYPGAPPDDVFCPPPYKGEFNRFRYEVDVPKMPKYLPTAITTTLYTDTDMRDITMTFIPQLGQADTSKFLTFRVSWLPADSLLYIDGVNRRADILLNSTKPEGQQQWVHADHLLFRSDSSFAYDYPEIVCGARSVVYFDIPVIYDPLGPNFGLWTTWRDV